MNTLQNIIKELKRGSHLELVNEQFSNETILNQSVQYCILAEVTFFNIDFRNVNFIGSHIVACDFKNCLFDNVMLIKCEFWNSTFENCRIENCNLTRAGFYGGNFKDCNFIDVDLIASDFSNFQFIETKFKNSKLDLIGVRSVKVTKSNKSVEIEKSSNFEKILKDMNLVISTDQNEIDNC